MRNQILTSDSILSLIVMYSGILRIFTESTTLATQTLVSNEQSILFSSQWRGYGRGHGHDLLGGYDHDGHGGRDSGGG